MTVQIIDEIQILDRIQAAVEIFPSATGIDIGTATIEIDIVGGGPSWAKLLATFVESADIRRVVKMTQADYNVIIPDPFTLYLLTA